ncbi:MAG: hypothetical protein Hyperionvirus1_177 [Hyperionvirus sp.]|uniref:TRAF-type domain-containing protein n=1 Tax=Hyperionvirus sp. TaxID=2487770 RepID=A0A3G5A5Z2_9VIRU|nr:MAG: hypothetical protein Hyperionvirus1_177 [Hyperionvirus sp.]
MAAAAVPVGVPLGHSHRGYHGKPPYFCRAAPGCDFKSDMIDEMDKHQHKCDKFVCTRAKYGCPVAGKFAVVSRHKCTFMRCRNRPCEFVGESKALGLHGELCGWRRIECKDCGAIVHHCEFAEHTIKCMLELVSCRLCADEMPLSVFLATHPKICSEKFSSSRRSWDEIMGKDAMDRTIAEMKNRLIEESYHFAWASKHPYTHDAVAVALAVIECRKKWQETQKLAEVFRDYLPLLQRLARTAI